MKKHLFLTLIYILWFAAVHAQTKTTEPDSNQVYTAVQEPATFPGGNAKFEEFIKTNQHKPDVSANARGGEIVTFVIEKDGSISSIQILRSLGDAYDAETLRLLKLSPKWVPAKQNGHLIRMLYTVAVKFN